MERQAARPACQPWAAGNNDQTMQGLRREGECSQAQHPSTAIVPKSKIKKNGWSYLRIRRGTLSGARFLVGNCTAYLAGKVLIEERDALAGGFRAPFALSTAKCT
jgi:hypothetical protein